MGITSLTQVDFEELNRKHIEYVLGKLVRGHQISYADPDYPGEYIREFPDGSRVSLDVTVEGGVTKVRDIPPKDYMNPDRIERLLAEKAWASYLDPEYPGFVVREHPDGSRIILHCHEDGPCTEGREIPPRKETTSQRLAEE